MIAAGVAWLLYLLWRSPRRDDLSTYGAFALPVVVIVVGWLVSAWRKGKADPSANAAADEGCQGTARAAGDRDQEGWIRVAEANPRRLGVHAAIGVPGVREEIPPEYVPRDVDLSDDGVRAKVRAAARRGGFVLLVGWSSVGKTRTAFEAVTAMLPDWRLVHPADASEVGSLATAPTAQTVIWLDELQRYLDGTHGLTGGVVRALLNASHPVVIIGTLWPDYYTTYTTLPEAEADSRAREREVLALADVVRIASEFTQGEQDRAGAAAARDPRLKIAMGTTGYGLTQALAAVPQLVARWEDARTAHPYAWAVLTAALDAARLGARAPLSTGFLRAAAPGYCTSREQAEAPKGWFEQALTYAVAKLHGGAAALSPAGSGMGLTSGYEVEDYLIQHAGQQRRYARLPASTWDAFVSHVHDPSDAARLAGSAMDRLRYRYAIPLFRRAADAGDIEAARMLGQLLAQQGRTDELRARADDGDQHAADALLDALKWQGDADGLRDLADDGVRHAAVALVEVLAEQGDADGLRALADGGDQYAATRLVCLLAERGDADGLRALAEGGDGEAAVGLAGLLAESGDADGLRALADACGPHAAEWFPRLAVDLLFARGDADGLRARADAGNWDAAWRLVDLFFARGDVDGLRARADAGDGIAQSRLPALVAQCSDDELRARADAGDTQAGALLAGNLANRGDMDGLRALAEAGDAAAARHLWLLDLDSARALADAGETHGVALLNHLLAQRGDLDELHRRLDAGDRLAAEPLADLYAKQGRAGDAERLRHFGLNPDGSIADAERTPGPRPEDVPLQPAVTGDR